MNARLISLLGCSLLFSVGCELGVAPPATTPQDPREESADANRTAPGSQDVPTQIHPAARWPTAAAQLASLQVPADAGVPDAGSVNSCLDGGTPPIFNCPGLTPRATPAELCASPRPDLDAELLAIEVSGAFMAPEPLYQQISGDLAIIRAGIPATQDLHHMPSFWPGMIVALDEEAGVDPQSFTGWDCLNAYYGGQIHHIYTAVLPGASFDYAAIMDTRQLAPDYATLAHVDLAESNGLLGDGDDICLVFEGADRVYLFDHGGGDCPAGCTEHHYYGARIWADGSLEALGDWVPGNGSAAPAWFTSHPDCTSRL